MNEIYDSIIIGASAAGISSAIYLKRQNLNFLIIAKDLGGEMALSGFVENYPGFPETNGVELTQKFKQHLEKYNIEPIYEEVITLEMISRKDTDIDAEERGKFTQNDADINADKRGQNTLNNADSNTRTDAESNLTQRNANNNFSVNPRDNNPRESASKSNNFRVDPRENNPRSSAIFIVKTNKNSYQTKTIIIATGSSPKKLNIPGEEKFYHRGVSYCSVCDLALFPNKVVAIVGGGNSANEGGIMGSRICQKVYVITKNPYMKGDKILIEELKSKPNVEIIYNALTQEIYGNEFVKGLKYLDQTTREVKDLKVDGVFIHIGLKPNTDFVPNEWGIKNEYGEIIINELCQTKIPGVFAAGDVTNIPHKQIGIAVGQGIISALEVVKYLNSHR